MRVPEHPASCRRLLAGAALLVAVVMASPVAAEPEGFNRTMLGFNRWLLRSVLEPTARGYNFVMPKWGQRRVTDFMANIEGPRDVVNSLLQAKLERAGIHTGRFVLNTTVGVAGFFDVADAWLEWSTAPETLDETFGVWGVPPGPYLILPVIGEFTTRGVFGWAGDGFLNPLSWIPDAPILAPTAGAYVLRNVNLLATGMPSPRDPEGAWEAYRQSRFDFPPYEVGRDLFLRDEQERVED
jgi:ABC-type transporter lipoprotein component MlaA